MLTHDEITLQLPKIFASFPEVLGVYLFGSYATGRAKANSDLDLAAVLEPGYSSRIKLELLTALAEQGFCDVDLVLLNNASPLVRYEAVKHNRLVYRVAAFDANGFFSRVILEYLDFEPYLELQRQKQQERMRRFLENYSEER